MDEKFDKTHPEAVIAELKRQKAGYAARGHAIDAMEQEIESLLSENRKLWELADEAVLTTLKMDKGVGAALIRFRSALGLSTLSTRHADD